MSDFATFSEAGAAALSSAGTGEPQVSPVPAVTEQAQTPPQQQTQVDPQQQDPPQTPDFSTSRHKVKVRGEELEVDYDDLLNGYSRTADYTRSKQELSQIREQVLQAAQQLEQRQNYYQQIEQILTNPQVLNQYLQHIGYTPAQAQAQIQNLQSQQAQIDPTDVPTFGDVQSALRGEVGKLQQQLSQMQQQFTQQTQRQLEQTKRELQTMTQAQEYGKEITNTLSSVFEQNPVLKEIDGMEDLLRHKVYQAQPATLDEAKNLFNQFASEQAAKLSASYEAMQKAKIAAKASLTKEGIEPPGGSGVTQQSRDMRFGSSDLRDAAAAYLTSLTQGR